MNNCIKISYFIEIKPGGGGLKIDSDDGCTVMWEHLITMTYT
jgi:hypothetical protein